MKRYAKLTLSLAKIMVELFSHKLESLNFLDAFIGSNLPLRLASRSRAAGGTITSSRVNIQSLIVPDKMYA